MRVLVRDDTLRKMAGGGHVLELLYSALRTNEIATGIQRWVHGASVLLLTLHIVSCDRKPLLSIPETNEAATWFATYDFYSANDDDPVRLLPHEGGLVLIGSIRGGPAFVLPLTSGGDAGPPILLDCDPISSSLSEQQCDDIRISHTLRLADGSMFLGGDARIQNSRSGSASIGVLLRITVNGNLLEFVSLGSHLPQDHPAFVSSDCWVAAVTERFDSQVIALVITPRDPPGWFASHYHFSPSLQPVVFGGVPADGHWWAFALRGNVGAIAGRETSSSGRPLAMLLDFTATFQQLQPPTPIRSVTLPDPGSIDRLFFHDGRLVGIGEVDTPSPFAGFVVYIGEDGSIESYETFFGQRPTAAVMLDSGSVLIAFRDLIGGDSVLASVGVDGTLEWESRFGDADRDWITDLRILDDGSILACGWTSSKSDDAPRKQVFVTTVTDEGGVSW